MADITVQLDADDYYRFCTNEDKAELLMQLACETEALENILVHIGKNQSDEMKAFVMLMASLYFPERKDLDKYLTEQTVYL